MANLAEITPVTRRSACDAWGHARLVFTITNVHDRKLKIHARVSAEAPIDSAWFVFEGGSERSLGPKAADQLVIDARLPEYVPVGNYRLRLEVSDAAQEQAGCDTSASVLLQVTQPLIADPATQPLNPDITPEHAASKRRLVWCWLAGLFSLLGRFLRRFLAPFSNWFWGGRSSAERVVDTGIVKKVLVLIAVVYGLSLASAIYSSSGKVEDTSAYREFVSDASGSDPGSGCRNLCEFFGDQACDK